MADRERPPAAEPYIIRLRGPWQFEPLARTVMLPDGTIYDQTGSLPPAGTVQVPADWGGTLGSKFYGRVRYRRRFGRPSGLSATDCVELVCCRVEAWAEVHLNGALLGSIPLHARDTRFDVSRLLLPRNELLIEVVRPELSGGSPALALGDSVGGLIGEVRLEIFAAQR